MRTFLALVAGGAASVAATYLLAKYGENLPDFMKSATIPGAVAVSTIVFGSGLMAFTLVGGVSHSGNLPIPTTK